VSVAGGPSTGKQRTIQYPAPAWLPPKRAGGLAIVGAKNVDGPGTADHIYQAKYVLPLVLRQFLAARWNAINPKDPDAGCFVAGVEGRTYSFGGPLGSVSSSCASSFVVPASFVQTGIKPEPLPAPSGSPVSPSTGDTKKRSLLVAGALVGLGTLGLWLMSKRPELAFRTNDSYSPFPSDVDPEQLRIGTALEAREHGMSRAQARKTALEHLAEDKLYYSKLAKMEKGAPVYGWDSVFRW
jgi:LPXTG-motif cell wall-anchored protein